MTAKVNKIFIKKTNRLNQDRFLKSYFFSKNKSFQHYYKKMNKRCLVIQKNTTFAA